MILKNIRFFMALTVSVIFSACACSPEMAIQKVLGGDTETPVFLGYRAISRREVAFQFSRSVTLVSLRLDPDLEVSGVEAGETLTVSFAGELPIGSKITADMLVEDGSGNTLEVLVSFRSRNDSMPSLVINELRTEYSKPRVEFIELKTSKAGNMGAIRVMIASQGLDKPVYEFQPIEVKAGEYIVLHLRTLESTQVDETGDNLAYCPSGTDVLDTARDLWVEGSASRLRKTDAVFILDQDDNVLDAVMLSETKDASWNKEYMVQAAAFLADQEAWIPAAGSGPIGPQDAVYTLGSTLTRSISRDESVPDSDSAADWYITATSGNTAGKANNPKRYEP